MTRPAWQLDHWAAVDIETTGLEESDRITEVAVVEMCHGRVIEPWSALVNPGFPIPTEVTALTGITDAMVANAPMFDDIAEEVLARINRCAVMVGYNLYGFDESRLAREGLVLTLPKIDLFPIVRSGRAINDVVGPGRYWKSPPRDPRPPGELGPLELPYRKPGGRHRLSTVAEKLKITFDEPGVTTGVHRAAWDAILAGRGLWEARHLTRRDARECERELRDEHARQTAETVAQRALYAERDKAEAERQAASVDSLERRLGLLVAMLEEKFARLP